MAEILVPPGGHTALSDPASVFLELVDESRHRKGMTEAEAYAFLAGADLSSSTLPPIVVAAGFDKNQLRDAAGKWVDTGHFPAGTQIFKNKHDALVARSPSGNWSFYDKDRKMWQSGGSFEKLRSQFTEVHQVRHDSADATQVLRRSFSRERVFAGLDENEANLIAQAWVDDSGDVNDPLRAGNAGADVERSARVLDKLIANSPLDADVELFRGFIDDEESVLPDVGGEFTDLGFTATSTSRATAEQFLQKGRAGFGSSKAGTRPVLLRVRVPRGAGALPMHLLSDYARETQGVDYDEVLLAREQRYRVISIDDSGPVREVIVEQIVDGPLTAAAEVHTGAMIALVPSDVDLGRLVVDGGEPRDQLHTTLVYLGQADDVSPNAKRALVERVRTLADGWGGPIKAEGFSINVFNPPGAARDDGKDRDACIVLGLSGGELDSIHSATEGLVRDVQQERSFPLPDQHRPWIPHVTLTYTDDVGRVATLADRVGPITFDKIRIAFAGDVVDVPLVS